MSGHRRLDEDDAAVGVAPWGAELRTPKAAPDAPAQAAPPPQQPRQAAPRRTNWAARFLIALLLLLAGAAGALFGAPRVAPYLPAAVATYLMPASDGGQARQIAELRSVLEREIAGLRTGFEREVVDLRGAVEAESAARREAIEALRGTLAADIAVVEDLAAAATEGVEALRDRPAPAPAPDGATVAAPDTETVARIADIEAAVIALSERLGQLSMADGVALPEGVLDGLRAQIAALDRRVEAAGSGDTAAVAALAERIAALEAALESGAALPPRTGTGEAAIQPEVAAALSEIDRALALGEPFGESLAMLERTAGLTAPEALRAAAGGAPTREALQASFATAAHAAVAEAMAAEADGEGAVGSVLARVQARLTGIPTTPTEGDTAPAILSRVRHDLINGRIAEALDGIGSLPEPAQAAMADWVADARLRSDADRAMAALRAEIGRAY